MPSLWNEETGYLVCRWRDVGERVPPRWMQELSEMPIGHVPPIPDFASHSPFGGVAWFQPDPNDPV